jgi:hypothetical protein
VVRDGGADVARREAVKPIGWRLCVQCWRTLCSTAMRCLGAMPLLCECVHIDDDAEASKEAPSGHLSQGMADRHDESM